MKKLKELYFDICKANFNNSYYNGVNSVLLVFIIYHMIIRKTNLTFLISVFIFYNIFIIPYLIRKSSKRKPDQAHKAYSSNNKCE